MTHFCLFLTCEPGFTVFLGNFIPAFRGFFAEKPGRTGGTSLSVNIGEWGGGGGGGGGGGPGEKPIIQNLGLPPPPPGDETDEI